MVRRKAPSEDLTRKCVSFLRELLGAMDVPKDEDGLKDFIVAAFNKKSERCERLLDEGYGKNNYPGREIAAAARGLFKKC